VARPLRVAIVGDTTLNDMGGVARSVLCITRELARLDEQRLRVTFVARRRPQGAGEVEFRRSFAPRVPRLPGALFALQRPLSLTGFDVVHYMDSRPPLDFALGRKLNVITQHGFAALMFGAEYTPRRVRAVNRALLWIAPWADLTFTASESERRELLGRSRIDSARVVAIHHGVDHDRFRLLDPDAASAEVRSRFGLGGRYVLYVSNHQRKKNSERLVEAFARVAKEVDDVDLVLTGWHTPQFALVLDVIEKLELQQRVHVLGHVPDEALPALYACAEVFTLPSLHEGFGLPVLESMACGTPVVAADVYALPEVCGEAAELVDPYDVDAIAQGILRVLTNSERAAELRELGLARAAGFTWQQSARRHFDEYMRALA
jgi:glycosyltransferase involved in cell wall biosynthesis